MRYILPIFILLLAVPAISQVRPDQFFEETNPNNANFELYSQKSGAPRRATLANVKKYMVPFLTDTVNFIPAATGNTTNLGEFVWDEFGGLWYIDGEGDAISFNGGGPIYVTSDSTAQTTVYAPAHGLTDTIALYGYVPVQADFTRANSSSADSVFIAYAVEAPHPDTLVLIFSGVLEYLTWHGKELNTQYYLQDDGSEDVAAGTVSMPTAIASDSTTLFLREVGVDIAGRLRRIAMPSPIITAFGGNPSSPTDAVVQAAIEGVYLPAGLAQPGTVFTLNYLTQSRNPTYQQTAPNTNPLTPSYAWLWDGAYATRIVTIPTSFDLQDNAYGTLGTLPLLPIDSLMAASVPTDDEVALWLDTNYTINNLRLPNGSLLYFIGDKTSQNPNYIWKVIDDVSDEFADTDWERIVKRVKEPGADGNGIIDSLPNGSITIDPNNNDLIIGTPAANNTGEFEFYALTDSGNDVTIYAGSPDSTSAILPADAVLMSYKSGGETGGFLANNRFLGKTYNAVVFGDSILISKYAADTLALFISQLPITGTSEKYVMVVDSASQLVSMVDADSFGGGGGSTVLEVSNDSINIQGGSAVKLGINELVTDSLANDSITFDFESRYQKIFSTDMTSAIAPVTVLLTNPIAAGVYNFEFTDITGSIDIVWPSNVKDLNRVSLGTYTYSGPFIQTLYYDGTNYIAIPQPEPAISFENDSLTTDTLSLDFASKYQRIFQVDMTSASDTTVITVSNPRTGGVYTLDLTDIAGGKSIQWPSNFTDLNGVALGTVDYPGAIMKTFYYDGTDYRAPPDLKPDIAFDSDSVTTSALTIDLSLNEQGIYEIDMASATNLTLTISNPLSGGAYTFHFLGVSGTDNVTWPADFYDVGGVALGTVSLTASIFYTCYYNPDRAKFYCK